MKSTTQTENHTTNQGVEDIMTETEFFSSLAELCMAEERRAPVVSEGTALAAAMLALAERSLTRQMARYFPTKMP
jgi:hypothetical protein